MRFHKDYFALVILALVLQGCGLNKDATQIAPPEFFTSVPVRSGFGFHAPWLDLYFTDPVNPLSAREVGGIDAFVVTAIVAARESVDVALRDLNLASVNNALIVANRRGIPVRVVTESDSMTARSNFQGLRDAGIVVVEDQQPGLMNNRFIVIDHKEVWTGSLSYDAAGVFREYNSLVRILSPEIAANYTKEFNEMFETKQFGPLIVPETPYPSVDIQGTQVEVLFSPDDIVAARLGQLISEAQQNIFFLAHVFTSPELGANVRARATDGIPITGVLEFDRINPDVVEEANFFRKAGLNIYLDPNPEVLNHAVMIIDGKIVVLGSYDFTSRAEYENDENVLIIHNEIVAQKFMEEFQRVQSRAQQ